MTEPHKTSIDLDEVEQFSRIADEWWDEKGKFRPLHKINPVRIEFLRDQIIDNFTTDIKDNNKPLSDISLIDVGCGGGLISEPMANIGATVTGLDASEKNINVAKLHADKSGLDINYICSSAEQHQAETNQYDVVLALEIIEHVADVDIFLEACAKMVKPNGLLIVSTMNRTLKAYAMAIIGAEYILRWLPRGTHDWNKFLRPSEIEQRTAQHNLKLKHLKGMVFNPLKDHWKISDNDIDVNYLMVFEKEQPFI